MELSTLLPINSITRVYSYILPFFIQKKNKQYHTISFCITCKNRTHHLQKTLLQNLRDNEQYPNLEFVVLDYNSQDGLEQWIIENFREYILQGRLRLIQTKEPEFFEMSHAKNMATKHATGEIICNVDADNFTGRNFAFFINNAYIKNPDIIGCAFWDSYPSHINTADEFCGSWGRVFISKKHFDDLGGYDETFTGWGLEDKDFKYRALAAKLHHKKIPLAFLRSIPNSESEKAKNQKLDTIKCSLIENEKKLHRNIKNKIIRVNKDGYGNGVTSVVAK